MATPSDPDIPLFEGRHEDWPQLRPHLHRVVLECIAEETAVDADTSDEEVGRNIRAIRIMWGRIQNKMAEVESAPTKPKRQRLKRE